jgi:hypothetical protein
VLWSSGPLSGTDDPVSCWSCGASESVSPRAMELAAVCPVGDNLSGLTGAACDPNGSARAQKIAGSFRCVRGTVARESGRQGARTRGAVVQVAKLFSEGT